MTNASPPGPTLEYNIKAWCSGSMQRPPSKRHKFGLEFELRDDDGHFYITKVEDLAKDFTEVRVGDRLYKFQDKPASEYKSVDELYHIMNTELKIAIETLHPKKMQQDILMVDIPVNKGDVLALRKDYNDKPEHQGKNVEIVRKLEKGKLLVTPVANKKEKIIIKSTDLDFEILTDQLQAKPRSGEDSEDEEEEKEKEEENKEEEEVEVESDQEEEEEKKKKKQEEEEAERARKEAEQDAEAESSSPEADATPALAIEAA